MYTLLFSSPFLWSLIIDEKKLDAIDQFTLFFFGFSRNLDMEQRERERERERESRYNGPFTCPIFYFHVIFYYYFNLIFPS
jgi:hypothetical protein